MKKHASRYAFMQSEKEKDYSTYFNLFKDVHEDVNNPHHVVTNKVKHKVSSYMTWPQSLCEAKGTKASMEQSFQDTTYFARENNVDCAKKGTMYERNENNCLIMLGTKCY